MIEETIFSFFVRFYYNRSQNNYDYMNHFPLSMLIIGWLIDINVDNSAAEVQSTRVININRWT